VYVGDPKSSPARVATIGGGSYLKNMMILKLCTRLTISQGMTLTPNKFFDLSADSPGKEFYFSKDMVFNFKFSNIYFI
jgi:hypothetical protein